MLSIFFMAGLLQYQLLCRFLICMGMSSKRWNYVRCWPGLMLRCIQRALQRESFHRKRSRDPRPSEKLERGELLSQLQKKTWTKQVLVAEPKAKDSLPPCQEYLQLDQGKHKYSSGDSLIGTAISGGVLLQSCWLQCCDEYCFSKSSPSPSWVNSHRWCLPVTRQAEETHLCRRHPFWTQQWQRHFWSSGVQMPGSRLAEKLRVTYVVQNNSWQRGDPDPSYRVLFLGGRSSNTWVTPSIKASSSSTHLLLFSSCLYPPCRELGVIKGSWVLKKSQSHWSSFEHIGYFWVISLALGWLLS